MQLFLGRFFGWYLWLGCYAAAIGALVGILFFSFPFLPILVLGFFAIYPTALGFAAPLNLFILPVAFHLLREHPERASCLSIVGVVGGFASPVIAATAWSALDLPVPWAVGVFLSPSPQFWDYARVMTMFSVVGTIAGLVSAKVFNRHGDKPSLFDIDGQLAALREQQSSAKSAGHSGSGTP